MKKRIRTGCFLLAICILLTFLSAGVLADDPNNSDFVVTGQLGSRVIQVLRPLRYGDPLRSDLTEVYQSLQPGEELRYVGNCAVSIRQPDGSMTSQVWDTAGLEDIRTVMLTLQPGDRLLFHEGSYVRLPSAAVSGTAAQPIQISGYGNGEARPVFAYGGSDYNLFEVSGCYLDISYLAFSGEGTGQGVVRLDGEAQPNGRRLARGITISDCVFSAIDAVSIACNRSDVDFEDITIRNNDFLQMRYTVLYLGQHDGASTGKNVQILDNFFDCTDINNASIVGYGMELKLGVTGSRIERNLILNPQGPGIMVYGAPSADGAPNVIANNLVIGSRNDAGIVVGGGPAEVNGNLAFRNALYGVYVQNYAGRNLTKNLTVTGNQSGLNGSPANEDYTSDQLTDPASCTVIGNSYHAVLPAAVEKAIGRIAAAKERPVGADGFFEALSQTALPLAEADLSALLGTLAAGTPQPYEPGADLIETGDNKAGFYRFPNPVTPDETGIASLTFKVTPQPGDVPGSALRLYLAFFGSNTTAGAGDVDNGKVPMQLEFRRSGGGGTPLNIRMYHSGGAVTDTGYNWAYGQTYEIRLELDTGSQTYRISIDGEVLGSGFRPLYAAETPAYGRVEAIGGFGFQQWNNTGSAYALLGDLPWVDHTPPPTDYGENVTDTAAGDAVIHRLAAPIVPDGENKLRFSFRISPQTLSAEGRFNFNLYLFGDDVTVSEADLQNETHMPFGVNLKHQNGNTFRILNGAGNESILSGATWSLDRAYDMAITVDVASQTYGLAVYDAATGDQLAASGDKPFFKQWDTGEADYRTPVIRIATMAYTQGSGSAKLGNLPAAAAPQNPDLNRDGRTDFADLSCLLYTFNAVGGDIPAGFDLVEDGIIDVADLLCMVSLLREANPGLLP